MKHPKRMLVIYLRGSAPEPQYVVQGASPNRSRNQQPATPSISKRSRPWYTGTNYSKQAGHLTTRIASPWSNTQVLQQPCGGAWKTRGIHSGYTNSTTTANR